ncbi:MAG: trigger factor [Floccifex sp.]
MEIKIGNYKGIEVEIKRVACTNDMVEQQVQYVLSQNPVKETKESIENGDSAVFDFQGLKDGVAFDGGTAENYEMVIGSGQFIPGFEEQMIGMKKGEEKDLHVTFPENYQEKSLAGQPVIFKVKVHDIFSKKPSQLNDDFVKSLNIPDVKNVDEFYAYTKAVLSNEAAKKDDEHVQDAVFEILMNTVEGDLPQDLIDVALNQQIARVETQLMQQGMALDSYLEMIGQTRDDLKSQFMDFATKQVRLEVALLEVARLENIVDVEDEIEEQMKLIASSYNIDIEMVKQQIPHDELEREMKLMKASQVVMDHAIVNFK